MTASLRSVIFVGIALAVVLCGCHLFEGDKDFDYGQVEQSVYQNDFFAISIKLPQDWQVQTKAQFDSIRAGKSGSQSSQNKVVKVSEVTSATLLSVCKYKSDTFFDFNPTMSALVEHIGPRSGTHSARDYLINAQKMLKHSPIHYESHDSISKEVIGGKLFYRLHARIVNGQLDISQDYYSAMMKGFCFSFILTYSNEEDWQQLKQMLSSVDFKEKE